MKLVHPEQVILCVNIRFAKQSVSGKIKFFISKLSTSEIKFIIDWWLTRLNLSLVEE